MTVPTNSTAPLPIVPSDPAVVAGETSVVRLGKRVRDWVAGLSPAGATSHSTGAVDLSAPGAPVGCFCIRNGKSVTVWAAGGQTVPSKGRILVGPANIVPLGLRPPTETSGVALQGSGVGILSVDDYGSLFLYNDADVAVSSWRGSVSYELP